MLRIRICRSPNPDPHSSVSQQQIRFLKSLVPDFLRGLDPDSHFEFPDPDSLFLLDPSDPDPHFISPVLSILLDPEIKKDDPSTKF